MTESSRWIVPVALVLATVVAFLPVLQNGFVNLDDDRNLLENVRYRGLGWGQLRWMFTTFHMGHYQPLSWMTLGLDYLLWGMNPFGYHLTNLFLHAVNGLLFYFVLLRLLALSISARPKEELPSRLAAGFGALLFAIHPLRVESVAWVTERRDVLSGSFFLLAILCYLNAVAVGKARYARWMALAIGAYALSLLSKASGVTLPLVLWILDIYPLRRLGSGKWFGKNVRGVWWEKAPFFGLAALFAVVAMLAQSHTGAMASVTQYGVVARLAQASFGLVFYLWKTIMPVGLSPLYELPARFTPWEWRFLIAGPAVLLLSGVLFLARRRWPAGLAAWGYYVAVVAPVSGIAQSGWQLAADRYSYLSCLGWPALVAGGLLYFRPGWLNKMTGGYVFLPVVGMAGLVVAGLGALTWRQTQVWHDSERLWRHALAATQPSSFAHNNLGNLSYTRGALDEARAHYREALRIRPDNAEARYNLGVAAAKGGALDEAAAHYREALKIRPEYAEAYNNLGNISQARGDFAEAIAHYRESLRLKPENAEAHNNLGYLLFTRGEPEEATRHYRAALAIDPRLAATHVNLADALARRGEVQEAILHYRQALQIDPNFAEARQLLDRALSRQGGR
jgi:Flp pilus assembly protein TadD